LTDTWRTWELVLPALERHHDVLAVTLAGHAGGPAIEGDVSDAVLADEVAPHAEKIVASPEGRRRATAYITVNFEHIPAALLAHQIRGAASCDAVLGLIEHALREACSGGSARRPRAHQSTRPRNPNRLLTGRGGRRSSVGAAPHAQMTSRSISDHRPALGDV
jgi:hypothetical protein